MCLAIPGQIQSIAGEDPKTRTAEVGFAGVMKTVQLACLPDAKVGDYVLVHAGFAISIVSEKDAREVFNYLSVMDELNELQPNRGGEDIAG